MKTIIRIEHPEDGCGIFSDRSKEFVHVHNRKISSFEYWSGDIGNIDRKHKNMDSARIIDGFNPGKHYCAYPSVDIMKQWINCEEIKQLITLGFIVLVLDVTEYIEHRDQILYTKESITSSKDISSLFI